MEYQMKNTFVYLYNLYLRCSINSKTNRSMLFRGARWTSGTFLGNHYCVTWQTQHGSNRFDIFIVNNTIVKFVKCAYLLQWEIVPFFYFFKKVACVNTKSWAKAKSKTFIKKKVRSKIFCKISIFTAFSWLEQPCQWNGQRKKATKYEQSLSPFTSSSW